MSEKQTSLSGSATSVTSPKELAKLRHAWAPRVVALAVFLTGLLDLISALTPAQHSRLHLLRQHAPGGVVNASTALTVATSILLIMLARGLRRRKKRAWVVTVLLLSLSVVLHLLKGLDVEEAVVNVLLVGALVALRRDFYALGDPRTRWRGVGVGALLLLTSVVIGMALVGLREDALHEPYDAFTVIKHVLLGMIGISGPIDWNADGYGMRTENLVGHVTLALGIMTGLVTAYLLLRPAEPAPGFTTDDEIKIRQLLASHGNQDSLGYFALRQDKSVIFSPSGKACIAYRVLSGVMLGSGDPLGDPEAWPGAIKEFLTKADRHAWTPAVMGCGQEAGSAWNRAGLTVLEIGDEAVLEVADFTLQGREMRGVRQAVNRVERAGYVTRVVRVQDLDADEAALLRNKAAAWRGADTERGFSMALGRFGDPRDSGCVTVMAYRRGVLCAFLHFVPWGSNGLSLDLMRRDRDCENGINEMLIVRAVEGSAALAVTRISLNFAVFRSALEQGERLGAGPMVRAWRGVLVFASRWFQIDSLYRFNVKFRPAWEPRYVCYPTGRDLPRVALAALEAEAFITAPKLPWSKNRHG